MFCSVLRIAGNSYSAPYNLTFHILRLCCTFGPQISSTCAIIQKFRAHSGYIYELNCSGGPVWIQLLRDSAKVHLEIAHLLPNKSLNLIECRQRRCLSKILTHPGKKINLNLSRSVDCQLLGLNFDKFRVIFVKILRFLYRNLAKL